MAAPEYTRPWRPSTHARQPALPRAHARTHARASPGLCPDHARFESFEQPKLLWSVMTGPRQTGDPSGDFLIKTDWRVRALRALGVYAALCRDSNLYACARVDGCVRARLAIHACARHACAQLASSMHKCRNMSPCSMCCTGTTTPYRPVK